MWAACASSWPEGQTRCSKQRPGHTTITWTRRCEPSEWSSTCEGAAIPPRPGSEWGPTATHVWHLMDFVDAAPVPELTPSIVEQLMEIIELQAGQASEPYDHWWYAWRVATGQESAVAGLSGYSSVVSALVERLRLVCADVPPPPEAPDMVHADLNPSNVLVRDGAVVAVVDVGNAGSGTRATDLTTLQWHTFQDPLDRVRRQLWTRILDLVGWKWAAMLAATQILLQLEWPIRLGRHDVIPRVVNRGHRALDELNALR